MIVLALLAACWGGLRAASGSTNSPGANRLLIVEPSSMPVTAGKVVLIIGALKRTDGGYSGDYKIKVSPLFFKSEKGRLAIIVSDESSARIGQGNAAAIIGTATTSGKGGKSRHVDVTVAPVDNDHGTLKLWFMAGDRQLIFEPAYHFGVAGKETALNPGR